MERENLLDGIQTPYAREQEPIHPRSSYPVKKHKCSEEKMSLIASIKQMNKEVMDIKLENESYSTLETICYGLTKILSSVEKEDIKIIELKKESRTAFASTNIYNTQRKLQVMKTAGRKPENKKDITLDSCLKCRTYYKGDNVDEEIPWIACEKCAGWYHIECVKTYVEYVTINGKVETRFVCCAKVN